MKRILFAVLSISLCLLCGCCLTYHLDDNGTYAIGYSNIERNAFICACYWDGDYDNMVITIPDTYNDLKITELGGYAGRGFPCPFYIGAPDSLSLEWVGDNVGNDDDYETLLFNVIIGKNIKKLTYVSGKDYWGIITYSEDGAQICDTLYKIVYYFEVDERNTAFYSIDGKLFYRDKNQLIDEFFYE